MTDTLISSVKNSMSTKTKIERIRMLQALHSAMADIENDAIDSSEDDEEGGDGTTANPQQDNRIRHLTKEIAILELEIAKTTNDMNLEEKTMHECEEEMEGLVETMMRLQPIIFFNPSFSSKLQTDSCKGHDISTVYANRVSWFPKFETDDSYEASFIRLYPKVLNWNTEHAQSIALAQKNAIDEMSETIDNLEHFKVAHEKSKKSYDVLVEKVAELKKTIETKKLLILQASKKK